MVLIIYVNRTILNALRLELLNRTSLDDIPEDVWSRVASLNTWGTNAVEGNSLTKEEVDQLVLRNSGVGNKPIRDILETVQHQQTFLKTCMEPRKKLDLVLILEMHDSVFRGILRDAGQWRRVNVKVSGSVLSPPRMEKVIESMVNWLKEYSEADVAGEDVFKLAAKMHHGFESIHPFSDGNGRIGRLLLNIHFLHHNWPPVSILPGDRETYLDAFAKADGGDFEPLEGLLEVLMSRSLLDFLESLGTSQDRLQPLKDLEKLTAHSAKYLALRASQGAFPALKSKGEWKSSRRALELYRCKGA